MKTFQPLQYNQEKKKICLQHRLSTKGQREIVAVKEEYTEKKRCCCNNNMCVITLQTVDMMYLIKTACTKC